MDVFGFEMDGVSRMDSQSSSYDVDMDEEVSNGIP